MSRYEDVTIVCGCGIRITGRLDSHTGRVYAARQPNNSAAQRPGTCMSCAEAKDSTHAST